MDLTGIAAVITSVSTLVAVVLNGRSTRRRVAEVHHEVKTSNGETLGALADMAEGRRIDKEKADHLREVAATKLEDA